MALLLVILSTLLLSVFAEYSINFDDPSSNLTYHYDSLVDFTDALVKVKLNLDYSYYSRLFSTGDGDPVDIITIRSPSGPNDLYDYMVFTVMSSGMPDGPPMVMILISSPVSSDDLFAKSFCIGMSPYDISDKLITVKIIGQYFTLDIEGVEQNESHFYCQDYPIGESGSGRMDLSTVVIGPNLKGCVSFLSFPGVDLLPADDCGFPVEFISGDATYFEGTCSNIPDSSVECPTNTPTEPGNIPLVDISPVNATLFMQDHVDVKLRCSIPDDPRAQFRFWTKDGKQIYAFRDSRREYEPSRSMLNIFDLRVEDSGKYTCVANLHNGIRVEGSTWLNVKPALTVVCTESQFVEVGSDITISCSVSGDTEPSVFMYWMKGSSPIENSAKYRLSMDKSSVRINNIHEEDGGTYTAVFQTTFGSKHESSSITVIMAPVILESPQSLTVATGSDVSLTCVYSGIPKPYFFWIKDDERIEVESGERITQTEEYVKKNVRRDILSIKRVSKVDAGVYSGFALNMAGTVDATGTGDKSDQATLRVIDPPVITVLPRNISLTKGESTSMECGYTGDQPLTIDWLYEGRTLTNSADNRIVLDSAAGTIKFATISSADTGQYTCRVQNEVGVVTATASLIVQVSDTTDGGEQCIYEIHAAFNHPNRKYAYVISRDQYVRLEADDRNMPVVSVVCEGYPLYVADQWPGIEGEVNAAFTDYYNGRTFFFVKSKPRRKVYCWNWNDYEMEMDGEDEGNTSFAALPQSDIKGIASYRDYVLLLFENEYYLWTPQTGLWEEPHTLPYQTGDKSVHVSGAFDAFLRGYFRSGSQQDAPEKYVLLRSSREMIGCDGELKLMEMYSYRRFEEDMNLQMCS